MSSLAWRTFEEYTSYGGCGVTNLGGCRWTSEASGTRSFDSLSNETVWGERSTSFVSSLSKLRGPSFRWRLRKASLSGVTTGRASFDVGSSGNASRKQQPPPQHIFSTSLVLVPPFSLSILCTSRGLCEMRAVEARRFLGVVGCTAASAAPLNASSVSSM